MLTSFRFHSLAALLLLTGCLQTVNGDTFDVAPKNDPLIGQYIDAVVLGSRLPNHRMRLQNGITVYEYDEPGSHFDSYTKRSKRVYCRIQLIIVDGIVTRVLYRDDIDTCKAFRTSGLPL